MYSSPYPDIPLSGSHPLIRIHPQKDVIAGYLIVFDNDVIYDYTFTSPLLALTMNLDVLRCKSEQGVRKELAVFCLVYNLVRVVMLEAARRQQVPVARVSFCDTLKWIRHARPGDALRELIINPRRPNRLEPR